MEQRRQWRGPAWLSQGFRPFFPLAALLAALAMAVWIGAVEAGSGVPSGLDPLAWHVHELVYGYVPAVLAGFLLTAVPNWTGRLPVVGWPLAALTAVWLLGRAAVMLSDALPPALLLGGVLAFPALLIFYLGREIVAAGNRRNAVVLALLAVYAGGLVLFHIEIWRDGAFGVGHRLSLASVILLVSLIGGRITPSFTANWLRKRGDARLPVPFGLPDRLALLASLPALVLWALALEEHRVFAPAAALAALAHAFRLARWRGLATRAEPLLLMLHLAYAFIPLGFALLALAAAGTAPVSPSAGLHAWTIGAVGGMTLAVMMRATLGHTGRALVATPGAIAAFALMLLAALARIGVEIGIDPWFGMPLAALAWILAMAVYLACFAPLSVGLSGKR